MIHVSSARLVPQLQEGSFPSLNTEVMICSLPASSSIYCQPWTSQEPPMQGFWPAHGCIWTYESNETQNKLGSSTCR